MVVTSKPDQKNTKFTNENHSKKHHNILVCQNTISYQMYLVSIYNIYFFKYYYSLLDDFEEYIINNFRAE